MWGCFFYSDVVAGHAGMERVTASSGMLAMLTLTLSRMSWEGTAQVRVDENTENIKIITLHKV